MALAILADSAGDDELALTCYLDFKWEVIATSTQGQPWSLDQVRIKAWLEARASVGIEDSPIGREVHSA